MKIARKRGKIKNKTCRKKKRREKKKKEKGERRRENIVV
jgi:hypothetical protein